MNYINNCLVSIKNNNNVLSSFKILMKIIDGFPESVLK